MIVRTNMSKLQLHARISFIGSIEIVQISMLTFFGLGILDLQLWVVCDMLHQGGSQGKGLCLYVDAGGFLMHAAPLIQLCSLLQQTSVHDQQTNIPSVHDNAPDMTKKMNHCLLQQCMVESSVRACKANKIVPLMKRPQTSVSATILHQDDPRFDATDGQHTSA